MNRQEHLEWCKTRALEYVEINDLTNAWASMCSDLNKHEETKDHAAIKIGTMLLVVGDLSTPKQMKKFILGFN